MQLKKSLHDLFLQANEGEKSSVMIRNYLKIALRTIRKNKFYGLINLAGLSIGISSCLLIGLYIADEWSFDRFHLNGDRIARLTMEYKEGSMTGWD